MNFLSRLTLKHIVTALIVFNAVIFSQAAHAQVGIGQPIQAPINSGGAVDLTDCVAQKDLQDIANHFSQFRNIANKDFCNDNSQTWHLLASLMFMKRTTFEAQMPNSKDDLFSQKFTADWYQYFIGRISDIDVVDSCEKGVVAYVYGFGGNTMFVCPMALTSTLSSLDRASVFMHEARHIDGYPHRTCSSGPRAGIQGACDTKISDTGSYAVTVETYAQLAKYAKGLNPALKAYAKASAVVYADEAFETPVKVNRTEQLMVMTENLDFNVVSLSTLSAQKIGKSPVAGKIFKRAQHMVLIPTDKNLPARYVFARNEGEITQSPGEMITEYNAQPIAEKMNLVDIHNGGQFTARIYKTTARLTCSPTSSTVSTVSLPPNTVAGTLVYPQGYDRAAKMVYLATEKGEIFEIGCKGAGGYIKPAALGFDQNYLRMYKVAGTVFGLTQNGDLFDVKTKLSTPINLNLASKIIEIAPFQSYEFFDAP